MIKPGMTFYISALKRFVIILSIRDEFKSRDGTKFTSYYCYNGEATYAAILSFSQIKRDFIVFELL